MSPRSDAIGEVLRLFGNEVGFDVANNCWQLGYACALGRVVLGDGDLEAPFGDEAAISSLAGRLFAWPSGDWTGWAGWGTRSPLDGAVVFDCLAFVTDELFRRLYPLYGEEGQIAARTALRSLAIRGYGLGRLQVEAAFREMAATTTGAASLEPASPPPLDPEQEPEPAPVAAPTAPEQIPEDETAPAEVEAVAAPAAAAGAKIEDLIPADARASMASVGGAFALDPDTGAVAVAMSGTTLAWITSDPPGLTWIDPAFGAFARMLLGYLVWTRQLQQNRGPDTFMLRGALREKLAVGPLFAAADAARLRTTKGGSFTTKEYWIDHPALGRFVSIRVLRGQSHAVDVTFLTDAFVPLNMLVGLEDSLPRG